MAKKIDLTGQKFGRLEALYDTGERKDGAVVWHCKCDCGNEVDVKSSNLTSGRTKSCGCLRRQRVAEANATHGMSREGGGTPSCMRYGPLCSSVVKTRIARATTTTVAAALQSALSGTTLWYLLNGLWHLAGRRA